MAGDNRGGTKCSKKKLKASKKNAKWRKKVTRVRIDKMQLTPMLAIFLECRLIFFPELGEQ